MSIRLGAKIDDRALERYRKKMRKIPYRAGIQAARAVREVALTMKGLARRDVPQRTGRLHDNIDAYAVKGSGGYIWRVYAGLAGPGEYDKGYWAPFVEFGTQDAPAQPFFFPNYRANKRKFVNKIARGFRKGIREAV